MKHVVIALMVALAFSSMAWGQEKTSIYKDSIGKAKITITKTTSAEPAAKVDPNSGLEYTDVVDTIHAADTSESYDLGYDLGKSLRDAGINKDTINGGIWLSLFAIIAVFGFPLIIVFMAFYFRYKNKKAKYRLIEQALASGQPLPENMLREDLKNIDTRTSGIKNTFLGLGLFIFLWAITGKFALGCIGLLVMCIGLGKWVTSMDRGRRNEDQK